MSTQQKYYIQLLSVCIGALVLSFCLTQLHTRYFNTNHYWIPTLFFGITAFGSNLVLTSGNKQSKEFVFKTLALSMARLLICMIVVFIYSLINKPQALAFTCHFMVQYLIFTIFEMSILLKYIKTN